jgi:hypothetical protein
LFQVDAEGYLDADRTMTLVKANEKWGQIFKDKDSLINRCITFGNSFSKGKYNLFIENSIYVLTTNDCFVTYRIHSVPFFSCP